MGVTRFESQVVASTVGTADIDKLTASLDKQSAALQGLGQSANKVNEHPGFGAFTDKVKAGIENPLQAAGSAVQSFLNALGPTGVALGTVATTIGAFAATSFSAAKSIAALGDSIEDTGTRMGLTTLEVQKVDYAMKLAGSEGVSGLEGWMRKLSNEIDGGGKNLEKMGIKYLDFRTGQALPMMSVLTQLSERWANMTDVTKRNSEATALAGRGALEALPDFIELSKNLKSVQGSKFLGDGFFDDARKAQKVTADLTHDWDILVAKLKQGVAVPIVWFFSSNGPRDKGMHSGGSMFDTYDSDIIGDALRNNTRGLLGRGEAQINSPLIAANDSAVETARLGSSSDQLTNARQKLAADLAKLKTGVLAPANAATFEAIAADRAQIATLEARAEAAKRLGEAISQLTQKLQEQTRADERMTSQHMGTVLKGQFQRQDMFFGGVPEWASGDLFSFNANQASLTAGFVGMRLRGNDDLTDWWAQREQSRIFNGERSINQATRMSSLQSQSAMMRAQAGGATPDQIQSLRLAQIEREFQAEQEIAKLKNDQFAMDDALANRTEKRYQAAMEREEALLRMALQQKEWFQGFASGGIDAALSGQGGRFLQQTGRGLLGQFTSNAAGMAWKSVSGMIPRAGDPDSTMGRLLAGTPFAADPLKTATDMNTAATVANTAALRSFMGGGGGGSMSSAASTFARMASTGGWSAAPGTYASGSDAFNTGYNDPMGLSRAGYGVEEFDSAGNGVMEGAPGVSPSSFGWGKAAGIGAAGIAGGFGVYSGIRQGGGRGAMTAAASAIATSGAIISLVSKSLSAAGPIGAIAGTVIGTLVPVLFGDPKRKRAEQLDSEAQSRAYTMPTGAEYSTDIYGRGTDYDYRGKMRLVQITMNVQAMDAGSFHDFLIAHPAALSSGLTAAIASGNGDDVVSTIQQRFN